MEFIFQLILIILLILLNGYFVASEYALVAVRRTRIDELAKAGNRSAKMVQKALDNLTSYISATQLGVTIASLGIGWIGEPTVAHLIEPYFSFLPSTQALITSHTLAVIIGFILITFFDIIIGELVPKSLAFQRAESTSLLLITPLVLFGKVFKPFIWILNQTGMLILRVIGAQPSADQQMIHSEEEIKMLLKQSSQGGIIPEREVEMVYNVFRLGDIPVRHVMVPRADILAFNMNASLDDVIAKIEHNPHSRFPVYKHTIDNIIGFIHVKDIYRESMKEKKSVPLEKLAIIRDILNVPEMKKIDALLQEMRKKRIHLAVVNDEFGGTSGIITLEDIIESVVGEIEDEFDQPLRAIKQLKNGKYVIDGNTPIETVRQKFHLPLKGQGYMTLGGLVFGLLGHEPRVGDSVQISDLILEVSETKGKRITQLELTQDKTEA